MLVTQGTAWRQVISRVSCPHPPTSQSRNEGNIMSSYTITITPDDTTRASTTLRIDVSNKAARITELSVRAGAAAGLSPQELPAVDLDLLLRAVNPATPTAIPGTVTDSGTAAQPARRVRGTRTAGRGRRGAAKQVEPKAATKRGAAKAGRAAKATSGGERAYRPAPADLV